MLHRTFFLTLCFGLGLCCAVPGAVLAAAAAVSEQAAGNDRSPPALPPADSLSLAEEYWQRQPATVPSADTGVWDYLIGGAGQAPATVGCFGAYRFPPVTVPPEAGAEAAPVTALADRGSYRIGAGAELYGNVRITQGDRVVRSSSAQIDLQRGSARFPETVTMVEPTAILRGNRAAVDLNTQATELEDVQFLLSPAEFRGRADAISVDPAGALRVDATTLTRCPPGNESWRFGASQLEIPADAAYAKLRNAVLRVGPVPVFYAPYLRFPVSDGRQSGWLFPNLAYSAEDGADFALPYYFNLAPNYDATLTPRLISDRGLGLEGEARHLSAFGTTTLVGAWLGDDDLYNGTLELDDFVEQTPGQPFAPADRWLYGATHAGRLPLPVGTLTTLVDYTAVSDGDYFRDLGNDLGVASRVQLNRFGEIAYQAGELEVRLWAQRFQVLDERIASPYQRMPELALSYGADLPGGLRASIGASWSEFDRDTRGLTGLNAVTGTRVHATPRIGLPLRWPFGFFDLAGGINLTRYDLNADEVSGLSSTFEESVTRRVPFGRLDAGLFFERTVELFGASLVQTLEPRIYYLRQQFEAQQDLPLFDSSPLAFQYRQLFRENRFAGLDRIGDANQLSAGVTTRLLDPETGRERFSASVGQIRYFDDREVTLSGQQVADDLQSGSALAAELTGTLWRNLRWAGVMLWDPYDNEVDESSLAIGWQPSARRILNLGFRSRAADQIEQSDFSVYWPLSSRYSVLGRWNYDLDSGRTIEALGGLEYNDCCWKIRVVARRFLDAAAARQVETIEPDTGVDLQIVFKGLAGFGNRVESVLERSIAGYQQP